jgi:hypothetical protein
MKAQTLTRLLVISLFLVLYSYVPDRTYNPPQYALIIPLYALAWKKNCIGRWFMVRPAIFIVMRIAFFALRMVLVKDGISEGVLSES